MSRLALAAVTMVLALAGCGESGAEEPGGGTTEPPATTQSDPYDY